MSSYDDLDPMFMPSPDAALEKVAVRVHALRLRRRVALASSLGVVIVVTALTSVAFAANRHPARIAVNDTVTTTTDVDPSTSTSTATGVARTVAPTTTTSTEPAVTPTSLPRPTTGPGSGGSATDGVGNVEMPTAPTTPPKPADLHFAFTPAHLVMQSGTTRTLTYTVTNDGDLPGHAQGANCWGDDLDAWPESGPVGWPTPAPGRVFCQSLIVANIAPHSSATFSYLVVAGRYDEANHLVPAPPGETTVPIDIVVTPSVRFPVTITPPAQMPFSSTFPAHVTVASGAAHTETFTLTNRLAAAVDYQLVGPCMRLVGASNGCSRNGAALSQRWRNGITLVAHQTVTLVMDLSGTSDLLPPGAGNSALAPGTYRFQGPGGLPLTLTVTP